MKLISCNIEGTRHLEERLLSFFKQEKADVLALQEVFECDLEAIKQASGLKNCIFYPQANIFKKNIHLPARGLWGVAIFANEIMESQIEIYAKHGLETPEFFANDNPNSMNRVLLAAKVLVQKEIFQVATTHFTWSNDGIVNDEQRQDFSALKTALNKFPELIFCGDLNTPRGYELWADLAKTYTDNMPAAIDTTIDKNLHKSGLDIRLVIDALFTSNHYVAQNIRVVPNTSDHMAVVAELARVV
jgi:endonuclease/exonuclease/phosphatase family metal-dependent hydrolase